MLLLVFHLDGQRYALHLPHVERVARAVAITPLPETSEAILGVVNVHGTVFPVVSTRRLFCLPPKEIDISDQLIIARSSSHRGVLPVDGVSGVVEYPASSLTEMAAIDQPTELAEGVVKLADGMVIVLNCETVLSPTAEAASCLAGTEETGLVDGQR